MKVLRESGWTFHTGAGGGVGYGWFSLEGGMFVLKDLEKKMHRFSLSAFGPSISRPLTSFLRVPKAALPKVVIKGDQLSGTGATTDFRSGGKLFLTESFQGADLTDPAALDGGVLCYEVAGGYLLGGNASIMLLGINRALLLLAIAKPELIGIAIRSAPAALAMAGANEGIQNALGLAFLLGQTTYQGIDTEARE